MSNDSVNLIESLEQLIAEKERLIIENKFLKAQLKKISEVANTTPEFELDPNSCSRLLTENKILDRRIERVSWLEVRTKGCFSNANIKFVGELVRSTEKEISSIKGLGPQSLHRLIKVLGSYNLSLGMNVGDWKPPED